MTDLLGFFLTSPVSHATFGILGGAAYLVRQRIKGYVIGRIEYFARPFIGALAAVVLTVLLGLPDHLTSLFVGYFSVDVWDALASRFDPRLVLGNFGKGLPLAFPPAHSPDSMLSPVNPIAAAVEGAAERAVVSALPAIKAEVVPAVVEAVAPAPEPAATDAAQSDAKP